MPKPGTILYLTGFFMIVVGIALSAAATAEVRNVTHCQDYCPAEELASIARVIAYYHSWGFAGLSMAFLGFVIVTAKSISSTKLRIFSILTSPLATVAGGLVSSRLPLYSAAGAVLSLTEKSGFPFAYRVTDCVQASLSYCPSGVYTVFDWINFTYDVFFFMAIGYGVVLVYSMIRRARA